MLVEQIEMLVEQLQMNLQEKLKRMALLKENGQLKRNHMWTFAKIDKYEYS